MSELGCFCVAARTPEACEGSCCPGVPGPGVRAEGQQGKGWSGTKEKPFRELHGARREVVALDPMCTGSRSAQPFFFLGQYVNDNVKTNNTITPVVQAVSDIFLRINRQTFRESLLCPSVEQSMWGSRRQPHVCISLQGVQRMLTRIVCFICTTAWRQRCCSSSCWTIERTEDEKLWAHSRGETWVQIFWQASRIHPHPHHSYHRSFSLSVYYVPSIILRALHPFPHTTL